MKNCLGINLGFSQGVCKITMTFDEGVHDLKLFISPGNEGKSVHITGLVPNEVINHFYRFEEIYILNEKTEKKFGVKKDAIHGYGIIEQKSFNLYPDIALGNLLKVSVQAFGDRVQLGDCSIVLTDPNFNETKHIIDTYNSQMHQKAAQIRRNMFYFFCVFVILVLTGFLFSFLVKRYKRVKQQTFEVAMSTRRERYADTARMINSARSDRPLGSVRGLSSARVNLNLGGGKDPVRSDRARDFGLSSKNHRRHMELPEHEEYDDEDN